MTTFNIFHFRKRQLLFGLFILSSVAGIYFFIFTSHDRSNKLAFRAHNAGPQYKHEPCCTLLNKSTTKVDTLEIYSNFDFEPDWLWLREFWDKSLEERYQKIEAENKRPVLKVFVVPHSHNDPGWLKSFESYFEEKSRKIINNIVTKLEEYKNMTFIWTEIAFLHAWWQTAHPKKQMALKKLVQEGRLEITSGGWVMPDEATTHIYALIDQLIEGHLWLNGTLGVHPKSGWSIDPFGHGPTVPYILAKSGIKGTSIQRIHYAWKRWFAENQMQNFHWQSGWETKNHNQMIVHNLPFDIYSIKSSCGPHPSICLSYDFRLIPGEYSEQSSRHEEITSENIERKATVLNDEYRRIGSLTSNNVILVPLGDDFRYDYPAEFDSQYLNYMKLFEYINEHREQLNTVVRFGTPIDYFREVMKREKNLPTLKGDFFVYSDVFTEGRPAYWSGYFTTRPFMKMLSRTLEHNLRTAEILYTYVSNRFIHPSVTLFLSKNKEKHFIKLYENLVKARRNLALFQHHDAITGTSKAFVMNDYGVKLFTSVVDCLRIQEIALSVILLPDYEPINWLQSDLEWESLNDEKKKTHIKVGKKIVLFNSLARERTEVVHITVDLSDIAVYDTRREQFVPHQVTPMIDDFLNANSTGFDVLFLADIPALTTVTFELMHAKNRSKKVSIYCKECHGQVKKKGFISNNLNSGDILLENSKLKLTFNRNKGLLATIFLKEQNKRKLFEINIGAYNSAERRSGAYLFMPDIESPERDILKENLIPPGRDHIIIMSGEIATEIITFYTPLIVHKVRIFNFEHLSNVVQLETTVDFEEPPKNRDTELYVRIQTDIQNGDIPQMYTDQNGFQYQKRVKIEKLGVEANYYPITNMVWIQDDDWRLSIVTDHGQGAASLSPGQLELMLDRRTLYDDNRGMGEGVVDNRKNIFQNWLLLEANTDKSEKKHHNTDSYDLPTYFANYLALISNHPINVFVAEIPKIQSEHLLKEFNILSNFPECVHLTNLRTISDSEHDHISSSTALMILHRQDFSCSFGTENWRAGRTQFTFYDDLFNSLNHKTLESVSLTGIIMKNRLKSFSEIQIEPMQIETFKVTF